MLVLNAKGGVMNVTHDVVGTLRAEDHGHQPLIYDARGNGDGGVSPTLTGDHQNRITDYTAIVIDDCCSKTVFERDDREHRNKPNA